jgi:hypothetical protein
LKYVLKDRFLEVYEWDGELNEDFDEFISGHSFKYYSDRTIEVAGRICCLLDYVIKGRGGALGVMSRNHLHSEYELAVPEEACHS